MMQRKNIGEGMIIDAARKEASRRGLTVYAVAQALKGTVSRTAVYRFFNDGTATVRTAEAIMGFLGLKVGR